MMFNWWLIWLDGTFTIWIIYTIAITAICFRLWWITNKYGKVKVDKGGIIYILKHPDTQEVKYVGKTTQPLKMRLQQHINHATGTILSNWIRDMTNLHKLPVMEKIDEALSKKELDELERKWIRIYSDKGVLLLNTIKYNGNETSPTERVRRYRSGIRLQRSPHLNLEQHIIE